MADIQAQSDSSTVAFPTAPHSGLSRRVFVGNLAFSVTWQDLKDHFRPFGEVVYANVMRGPDNRSKGCGIVEFKTPAEATNAINTLNNSQFRNRQMFCREDREDRDLKAAGIQLGDGEAPRARPPRAAAPFSADQQQQQQQQGSRMPQYRNTNNNGAPRQPFAGKPSSSSTTPTPQSAPGTTVFVGNMPFQCAEVDLRAFFAQAGVITSVLIPETTNGRPKGFALITFSSREEAQRCVASFNGSSLHERKLDVHVDLKNQ